MILSADPISTTKTHTLALDLVSDIVVENAGNEQVHQIRADLARVQNAQEALAQARD